MNWTPSFLFQSDKLAIVPHLLLAPVGTMVNNPVASSCEICPNSCASFCTRHSSSTIGPASALSTAPVTSSSVRRRPRRTYVANEIVKISGFVTLPASSSTIGWQLVMNVASCFVFVTRAPENDSNVRNACLGALNPAVTRIFMQKKSWPCSPVIDFHQRLQVTHSIGLQGFSATSGLVGS